MNKPWYEAVIFDMDGLLVDSEPIWRKVEIACFAKVGLQLSESDCRKTKGLRIDEVVDYWFDKFPWKGLSRIEMVKMIVDEMEKSLLVQSVPLPGVLNTIKLFKKAGVKMAIASSSQLRLINAVVRCLKLEEDLPVLCSAETEDFGKPHPSVFLTTAKVLNVEPIKCIVFEDSITGVLAAKAARMFCIAVPETAELEDQRFSIADVKIDSLNAFNLSLIKDENI